MKGLIGRGWMLMGVGVCLASSVLADGFRNPPDGATAVGRIGAKIAGVDDASAVSHNPGNLTDLQKLTVEPTVTFGYAKKEFSPATGGKAETEDPWAVLPSAYAAWPVPEIDSVAAIGLTTPFGRSSIYDEDSVLRYTAPYYSRLRSVNVNPTVATKLGEQVSVAAGVDILWSDLTLKQILPWSVATGIPMAPDGQTTFDGSGVGWGWNVGLTWKPAPKHRVGLTYRAPISVDYDGDFDVTEMPAPAGMMGLTPSSDFSTTIDFPAVAGLGYEYRLTDTLKLEADVEWVQHSVFDSLTVDIGNNNALMPSRTTPADWKDTWTFGLGAEWAFRPNWVLRGSWMYLPTPAPGSTLLPSAAEESQSVLSAGLGWTHAAHRVDAGYAIGLFDGRTVRNNVNPAYNGDYDFESHLVALSYQYSF